MAKWLTIAGLLGLLGLTLWIVYRQWSLVDVPVPGWAWAAIAVGVVFAVLVGSGLMALIFYSNREGYDEPPHRIDQDEEK